MDLRQLASFVETAHTGSYASAGRRLHLAQPAVWKHVHQLQTELGLALFARVGRGIQLTQAGRTLLPRAEQVLDGADRLGELASDLRAGRSGTVTVGCLAPHVIGFLADALGRLSTTHPSVRVVFHEIDIHEGAPGAFGEALRSGTVDIVLGPYLAGTDAFEAYVVEAVCAVPDGHPWRIRPSVDVEELEGERLLLAPAGYFTRNALEGTSRTRGFELDVAFESASPSVLVKLGEEGLGLAIIGGDALPPPSRPWPVLTVDGRPLASPVWLSAREHRDATISAVFDVAREVADGRRAGDHGVD